MEFVCAESKQVYIEKLCCYQLYVGIFLIINWIKLFQFPHGIITGTLCFKEVNDYSFNPPLNHKCLPPRTSCHRGLRLVLSCPSLIIHLIPHWIVSVFLLVHCVIEVFHWCCRVHLWWWNRGIKELQIIFFGKQI